MAATPKSASFTLTGRGGSKSLDAYVSDVAGANVRFDSGAGASATSDTFYIAQADGVITRFSMVTGTADTTRISIVLNGVQIGSILRYDVNLTTLANPQQLAIPFKAGDKISAIQLA